MAAIAISMYFGWLPALVGGLLFAAVSADMMIAVDLMLI